MTTGRAAESGAGACRPGLVLLPLSQGGAHRGRKGHVSRGQVHVRQPGWEVEVTSGNVTPFRRLWSCCFLVRGS